MKLQFKPLNTPLLFLNDAPDHHTGLARIGRDLASLACTLPEFRVGYLGLGGVGRRKLPWMQYSFPSDADFGQHHIQEVWHDFAGEEHGIIMSLWDASRMLWFGQPQSQPNQALRVFLGEGRSFQKWGYFPIDSTGPNGISLSGGMTSAVMGYDRVLAASEWGGEVLRQSGRGDVDWIPHGLWLDKFKPDNRARLLMRRSADAPVESVIEIGCNMSNQARKDWPVAFEAAAILRQHYGNRFRFWAHTDALIRHWNLYALAADFGVSDCTDITMELSDEQLALRYSACDCTMLPSGGEGFGYPVAESMACGTACVVPDYAAAQELVPEVWRVRPVTYRIDTIHNVQRCVLNGHGFAEAMKVQIELKRVDWQGRGEEIREGVEHLEWGKLQTVWKKWLLDGVRR